MTSDTTSHDPCPGGPAPAGASGPPTDAGAQGMPAVEQSIPLRRLLLSLGEPLVDVLAAPAGLDVPVDNVVILDPEDEGGAESGDLVLLVGARGTAARRVIRSAALRGASAVAVKTTGAGQAAEPSYPPPHGWGSKPAYPPRRPGPDELDQLRAEAGEAGIAVLAVRPEVRWDQLQTLCQGIVDNARLTAADDLGDTAGDLFSMAQTIARLTGGLVSIEDSASRVLAYSGGAEVDELRRLSVLGRQGPESYLALLREWGVFSRLRSGEEVVRIEEHPELGIRRRLAVGIHAGRQPLGTIWVQEGAQPLTQRAEEALLGAARTTALHLIRQRTQVSAGLRLREDLLSNLLEGRIDVGALADTVEVDTRRAALVAAFSLARPTAGPEHERSGRELRRRQLIDLIAVHTAAYRRSSLVTELGGRVYVLLPDLSRAPAGAAGAETEEAAPRSSAEQSVLALTRKTVEAARGVLGVAVQGAVGSLVDSLADVPRSRVEADRVLDAMGRDLDLDVATISDVRAQVLISETLAQLRANPALRDPRVSLLVEHDRAAGSELVASLLAYLEEFGDVRAAAERLHVHPNTLRYRVRRASAVSGIDLSDTGERLFTQLQLLMEQHPPAGR